RPEDRNHRVADELLDRAAVLFDRMVGGLREAAKDLPVRLRIEAVADPGRADEIAEENRHPPPRLAARSGQGRRAAEAEPCVRGVRLAASRTGLHAASVTGISAGREARDAARGPAATSLEGVDQQEDVQAADHG